LVVKERRLAFVDRAAQRVVTIVEYLSPANKVRGSAGRRSYDEKKHEVLNSDANLVEIDLLRQGIPLYARAGFAPSDYLAPVWRWTGERHRRWVWRMPVDERLPTIPVPVRLGDQDAALDLQAALITAYDRAGYDLIVDYTRGTTPPLPAEKVSWARGILNRPEG
jgi:hypothetical protein